MRSERAFSGTRPSTSAADGRSRPRGGRCGCLVSRCGARPGGGGGVVTASMTSTSGAVRRPALRHIRCPVNRIGSADGREVGPRAGGVDPATGAGVHVIDGAMLGGRTAATRPGHRRRRRAVHAGRGTRITSAGAHRMGGAAGEQGFRRRLRTRQSSRKTVRFSRPRCTARIGVQNRRCSGCRGTSSARRRIHGGVPGAAWRFAACGDCGPGTVRTRPARPALLLSGGGRPSRHARTDIWRLRSSDAHRPEGRSRMRSGARRIGRHRSTRADGTSTASCHENSSRHGSATPA
jgi:hypothetical protein